MVTEVVEEVNDVIVSPDVVVPEGGGGGHEGHTAPGSPTAQRTHGAGVPPLVLRARGSPLLGPQGDPPALSQEGRDARDGHSHLLEAAHAVQDVELLPALGEVHLPVDVVRVPQVDEGEVLQDEAPGGGHATEHPGGGSEAAGVWAGAHERVWVLVLLLAGTPDSQALGLREGGLRPACYVGSPATPVLVRQSPSPPGTSHRDGRTESRTRWWRRSIPRVMGAVTCSHRGREAT